MLKRQRLFSTITLLATLISASASQAELKGSYQLNNGKQKLDLYYADDRHMRANLDDNDRSIGQRHRTFGKGEIGGEDADVGGGHIGHSLCFFCWSHARSFARPN